MIALLALALFAQVLSPGVAYTTADPVNPEQFGLATQDGRYRAEVSDTGDCSAIGPDMRVMVWQVPSNDGMAMYTAVAPLQEDGQYDFDTVCWIVVYQKMSPVPCFQADGICDPDGDATPTVTSEQEVLDRSSGVRVVDWL